MALAEQPLQVFLRNVAVAGGDVDDQLWTPLSSVDSGKGEWLAVRLQAAGQGVAHQPFDQGSVNRQRAHDRVPSASGCLFNGASASLAKINWISVCSTNARCSAVRP